MLATHRESFTSREAVDLAEVTYRQADYWTRLGLIEPMTGAHGSGSRRRWSIEDILALRVVHLLMRHRIPQDTIREVLADLDVLGVKPLVWIRGREASTGDAFDFLAEAERLQADEVVLVFSPSAMLRDLRHNLG